MKKNYASPKIKLIKVNTENVMQTISGVTTTTPDGKPTEGPNPSTGGAWNGNNQPETAKDNNGFDLWGNED